MVTISIRASFVGLLLSQFNKGQYSGMEIPFMASYPRNLEGCVSMLPFGEMPRSTGLMQAQTAALNDLFLSTNGSGWLRNSGWHSGDPCLNYWFGIECDCGGNVVAIRLPDNRLVGSIPASIGQLASLEVMDMHSSIPSDRNANKIVGELPSLANLTSLRIIDFSGNSISGLPSDIGMNTDLQVISVSRNRVANLPSNLGGLQSLRVLEIDSNEGLEAAFPVNDICAMPDLLIVNMGNNSITGPFFDSCLERLNPLLFDFSALLTLSDDDTWGLEGDVPAELVHDWTRVDQGYISFYLQPDLSGHFGSVCADLRFCLWQNFRSHGDLSGITSDSEVPEEVFKTINLAVV